MVPKLGLNLSPLAPEVLVEGAQLAEQLGFASVWLGEHVAVPGDLEERYEDPQRPFTPDSPFLGPLAALAHIAARRARYDSAPAWCCSRCATWSRRPSWS